MNRHRPSGLFWGFLRTLKISLETVERNEQSYANYVCTACVFENIHSMRRFENCWFSTQEGEWILKRPPAWMPCLCLNCLLGKVENHL